MCEYEKNQKNKFELEGRAFWSEPSWWLDHVHGLFVPDNHKVQPKNCVDVALKNIKMAFDCWNSEKDSQLEMGF